MYLALYRRFRPETFGKVLGQEHIVKILSNQIRDGVTGHAYLFCGTRGTGKTTMARLLAKGVNCLAETGRPCGACKHCVDIKEGVFMDVIEIDAASNNGVDNIRELNESVKYPPVEGRRKAYIIDEVHMLSSGAFNALLKTLEEPPEHVMFILATTEPQKLPATILSRCLRLDFKRVPADTIKKGMAGICRELGVKASDDALALLASNADGSVRDGLSLLDQCLAAGDEVTRETVLELVGSPGEEQLAELTEMVWRRDVTGALAALARMLADGKEEKQIMRDWIEYFRDLMLLQHVKNPEDVLNLSVENITRMKAQSAALSRAFIRECIFSLAKALNDARWSSQPRILLEVAMIELAAPTEAEAAMAEKMVARPVGTAVGANGIRPQSPAAHLPEIIAADPSAGANDIRPQPQAAMLPEAAAPAPPADEAPVAAEGGSKIDWDGIVADATKGRRLLNRLKGRSGVMEPNTDKLVVGIYDDITLKMAQESRELLEQAAAKRGVALPMEFKLTEPPSSIGGKDPPPKGAAAGSDLKQAAVSSEELARRLEETFNMKVEIE